MRLAELLWFHAIVIASVTDPTFTLDNVPIEEHDPIDRDAIARRPGPSQHSPGPV
jgi:hypothetical protein